MGASKASDHRINFDDDLDVRQCWTDGLIRKASTTWRPEPRSRGILGSLRQQSCRSSSHRLHLPIRGFLRAHLGTSELDLPPRAIPTTSPWQSSLSHHSLELDLQLRAFILCPSSIRKHPVEGVHPLRRLLRCHDDSCLLCLPRDIGQDS